LALLARSKGVPAGLAELRLAAQQDKSALATWVRDETRRAYDRLGQSTANQSLVMIMQNRLEFRNEDSEFNVQPFAQHWRGDGANIVLAESFRYGRGDVLAKQSLLREQLSSVTGTTQRPINAAILGNEFAADSDNLLLVRDRMTADISHVIDRIDPSMLVIEWPAVAGRLDGELHQMLRSLAAMPAKNMRRIEPADPASQTVHVRSGTKDGYSYVSMISLVPWTSEVHFQTSLPVDWVPAGETNSQTSVSIRQISGTRASVVVPAGQLIVLQSKTPVSNAAIKPWSSRVSGGAAALETIKQKVTLVVERIGTLSDFDSYDALTNGGFERAGGMGLVGWLQAQHPPGCVRIDDKEFVEGKNSVLLTTDPAAANRTWIVSETIDPPPSGRLAVSLACRGELKEGDSVHRLRVSIEAIRNEKPIRYTNEYDVPRNGKWGSREVVLEADGIEGASVDSIRLTIDSLSGGRVWIDDVRLHDQFPTAKERAELQSQAFLAVQGLQRGNLTPSGRLLHNHWARRLLALGPAQQSKQVIEKVKTPVETPGVADRIRSWLPRPLRF
jgi:hypothetical protein